MSVHNVTGPAPTNSTAVPTLVATQQEAKKEAVSNIQDGDESLGASVDKLA